MEAYTDHLLGHLDFQTLVDATYSCAVAVKLVASMDVDTVPTSTSRSQKCWRLHLGTCYLASCLRSLAQESDLAVYSEDVLGNTNREWL